MYGVISLRQSCIQKLLFRLLYIRFNRRSEGWVHTTETLCTCTAKLFLKTFDFLLPIFNLLKCFYKQNKKSSKELLKDCQLLCVCVCYNYSYRSYSIVYYSIL